MPRALLMAHKKMRAQAFLPSLLLVFSILLPITPNNNSATLSPTNEVRALGRFQSSSAERGGGGRISGHVCSTNPWFAHMFAPFSILWSFHHYTRFVCLYKIVSIFCPWQFGLSPVTRSLLFQELVFRKCLCPLPLQSLTSSISLENNDWRNSANFLGTILWTSNPICVSGWCPNGKPFPLAFRNLVSVTFFQSIFDETSHQ